MEKFENAMECIGQAVFEMYENNTPEKVNTLLTNVSDAYVLVQWPESQEFMEEEGLKKNLFLL